MEPSEPDHYVKGIHSVFKIKIDNIEKAKKRIGQSIYKKKFSPFPGLVFQIKLRNIDSIRFSVFLKNCGKTSFQMKSFHKKKPGPSYGYSQPESEVLLLPGNSLEMKFQEFLNYYTQYYTSGFKQEFVFECSAEFILPKFGKNIFYF
jgi:hypothetical protein